MNTLNKKNYKKKIVISIVIIGALLGIFVWYVFIYKGSIFGWSIDQHPVNTTTNYQAATNEQVSNGQSIKEESVKNEGSSGSDRPSQPTPQPNAKSIVDMSITAANQNDSLLQVRTLIGTVVMGNCKLTLQKTNHHTITKSSETQSGPNTSTCKGFDIPLTELEVGDWSITATYESTELTGSANKKVSIR